MSGFPVIRSCPEAGSMVVLWRLVSAVMVAGSLCDGLRADDEASADPRTGSPDVATSLSFEAPHGPVFTARVKRPQGELGRRIRDQIQIAFESGHESVTGAGAGGLDARFLRVSSALGTVASVVTMGTDARRPGLVDGRFHEHREAIGTVPRVLYSGVCDESQ